MPIAIPFVIFGVPEQALHASDGPALLKQAGTLTACGNRRTGVRDSERTVSRYLSQLHRRDGAAQLWRTFLKNHRELIAGMDFSTVITAKGPKW
ncbi:MAG: hypothetical protein ABSB86_21075 [Bryobacteraceae bacterium]